MPRVADASSGRCGEGRPTTRVWPDTRNRRVLIEEIPMTTVETSASPDTTAVEQFGDRMVRMINEAMTSLLVSLGHQAGLFDALMAVGPATSTHVAETAGCNERYVREWLSGLTVARIVLHDATDDTYRLPPEHAAWLTTEAGPQNLARTIQFVPMMAEVEQDILACVRAGGGLSYEKYPRFHALMDEDSRATIDQSLIDGIVPLVSGLDRRLRSGIDVADIGCGSGHAINVLAQTYPASRCVGFDFSEEAIARARTEAAELGLTNARFELRDVALLDEPGHFDLVTAFDAIHDQADPARVLAQVARALRPDGTFLMVDIRASSNLDDNLDHPFAAGLYTMSLFHCMSVSLGLGGAGLGTLWGRQVATSLLRDAGFTDVDILEIEADPFNDFYVCRRA
jgi:SAM-dependent methyltransferase